MATTTIMIEEPSTMLLLTTPKQEQLPLFCCFSNANSSYSTHKDLVLANLNTFYQNQAYLDKFCSLIAKDSTEISLRVFDWFATNYAKKFHTVITRPKIQGCANDTTSTSFANAAVMQVERLKVFEDYKLQLSKYHKQMFDPFCRAGEADNILFTYNGQAFETGIKQLNFFKWIIENKIDTYIKEHHAEITVDMKTNGSTAKHKEHTSNTNNKTRKKREELSSSANKFIIKEQVDIDIIF